MQIKRLAIFIIFSLVALFFTPQNNASISTPNYQTNAQRKAKHLAESHKVKSLYKQSTHRVQDFKKYNKAIGFGIHTYFVSQLNVLSHNATNCPVSQPSADKNDTEVVERWMSEAELKATQETGLLRGGRDGTHYVTDSSNSNAKRARQRSALPQTPEVKVTLEVPKGVFSNPSKVKPAFDMPGGGLERTATGKIQVKINKIIR